MLKYFKLEENGTTVKREVIGGITTFLAMAYIIFVNPSILSLAGMDKGALITVTIVGCALGTLAAAFIANVPLATGPGMGLNAFFTFSLVMGKNIPWETALGIVFISSVIYLFLSLGGIREKIANAIPHTLQVAVTVGIGLFIAFIGLKSLGFIVAHPATFVTLGKFTPTLLVGLLGLVVIFLLEAKGVTGAMLIGIAVATVGGILIGDVKLPAQLISLPPSMAPVFLKLDILGALKVSLMGPIFTFLFVNMFDGLGMLIAVSKSMGRIDKDGNIKNLGTMMQIDVGTTMVGSLMGTSTLCYFAESASGIAAGARTGLASVVTGCLFILALLFAPVIGVVPAYATAGPLIMVGVFMFKNIQELDYSNFKTLIPAFLTILLMPLTYSISVGLSFGFLSYILIHLFTGEREKVNSWLLFIGILSAINLATL